MPRIRRIQSSFNSGVLDPRLAARIDIRAYNNGAEKLDNALCIPQGGVSRRPALKYIDKMEVPSTRLTGMVITAPNGGTTANANDNDDTTLLSTTTAIGTTSTYVVVHYDLGSAQTVRFADVLNATITGGSSNDFYIQYSTDNVSFTSLTPYVYLDTTSRDIRIPCNITARYWRLARSFVSEDEGVNTISIGELNLWSAAITNTARLVPFSFNTEQNYMLCFLGAATFGTMAVYKDDALLVQIPTSITASQIDDINWTQTADTLIITHKDIAPTRIVRDTTLEGLWLIDSVPLTNIPQYDYGSGSGTENVWSSSRGWPLNVTFFEGRMVFGGSKGRPQGIWMSKSNDFYNFDVGTGLPDEAIVGALDTDQVNEIRNIVPSRKLQIMTSGGEFIVPVSPILPENFSAVRQTSYGSANVRTASIDGATLYVQRNGQGFREFLFSFQEDANVSNSVSQLSSHLINTPVDIAAVSGTQTNETNYVYLVNTAGDVVVLNTLREQEIAAWSGPWTTSSDSFKRVAVLDYDTYFMVERTINSQTVNYLEKLDESLYTDSAFYSASHSSATVTGLDHLEGESVRIKLGGAIQANKTVSGGSITLDRTPSAETLEIGIDFNPTITTMPVNSGLQDGPDLNREKRIVRATLNIFESLGIFVNNERLPDRQLDVDTFDAVPVPSSDVVELYLHGWSKKAQITISQQDPVPLTVLGIDLEVSS